MRGPGKSMLETRVASVQGSWKLCSAPVWPTGGVYYIGSIFYGLSMLSWHDGQRKAVSRPSDIEDMVDIRGCLSTSPGAVRHRSQKEQVGGEGYESMSAPLLWHILGFCGTA